MTGAARRFERHGAPAQSMRRVVFGMLSMLGLALAVVAALKLLEARHINTLLGYSEDNASWAVHQLEAEYQRLEIALLAAQHEAPGALKEAALRYETFISRKNVLASGVFHRNLKELPAYPALMAAFDRMLASNDPMMADGLQAGEVAALVAAAAAMAAPVHDMVLAENALVNRIEGESRVRIVLVRNISLVTLGILGALLLGFAAYALVVLRRARESELALGRSEDALRSALQQAQSANAAKSAFLANMSHELRTPLNAVIGFSEFLEISASDRLEERQRGYLADIRASGRHLLDILSTILELSKLEAGKVELQIEQVPARELIAECVRMLAPRAADGGIVLEAIGLDGLSSIAGDHTRLRQIFINLLSNAVKYSSEGGRVRVVGSEAGGFITVRVEDEGIGMNSADIETALRPFERIRNAQTVSREGVGLGLTIVKTLVDIHGGQLEIRSELGHGTIVAVRLPAGSSRPPAMAGDGGPRAPSDDQPAKLRRVVAPG
jgi:two-component system cell cycle sensor histidine kinase PleC